MYDAQNQTVIPTIQTPAGTALILMYHRITDVSSDPWGLCVTPQHFQEHLEVLRRETQPVPLRELVNALDSKKIPERAVAVTFDDGYTDNLYIAKPLLERYEIPATVFVVTGTIDHPEEFWWDKLDRVLLRRGTLPVEFDLQINGNSYHWELGEWANYTHEKCIQNRAWRAWQEPANTRQSFYLSIWRVVREASFCEHQQIMNALENWANVEETGGVACTLSQAEVLRLADRNLLDVESHSVTHPMLSALPLDLQRDEIQRSKAELEKILGYQVNGFAYPYGDYTLETLRIVQQSGFRYACTTSAAAVKENSDLYQLPRQQIHDWDGEEFSRWLSSAWVV